MAAGTSPTKPREGRKAARRRRNRAVKLCRSEAVRAIAGQTLEPVDPADALQAVLDRGVAMLSYAMDRVDSMDESELWIDTPFGPIKHEWFQLEGEMRKEVGYVAARMVDIGIADRAVRLEEAKAALLVRAVMEAAREAGISRDKVKAMGPAIRRHLTVLEGGAGAA